MFNSDSLYYGGAIAYNQEIKPPTLKFNYKKFKFAMWNHFINIQKDIGNKIVLRTIVYNPLYIMPSLATVDFFMNFPPSECILTVEPLEGIELITNFKISLT